MSRGETTEIGMTGRRSAAMDEAVKLSSQGVPTYKAAKIVGVSPSALYRAIKQDNKRKELECEESKTRPSA